MRNVGLELGDAKVATQIDRTLASAPMLPFSDDLVLKDYVVYKNPVPDEEIMVFGSLKDRLGQRLGQ